ncbi:G-protein coupled receptor 54-like [Ptychodera flava]|uniref:G-protein coupled receptor 54-like n=1 Tax=Ptychodera flava TaxID=63121 RepID=UPI00396A7D34
MEYGNILYPSTLLNETGNTTNVSAYDDYEYTPELYVETWLVPTIFALICLVGVAGNSMVIVVILRHKQMKTTTNFYILSVAIVDLAFLVCCVPFTVFALITEWFFGDFMCKFSYYLIFVTVQANCFTLTAMTVDRYFAIVHPMASISRRSPKVVLVVSIAIWLVAGTTNVPVALYRKVMYINWFGTQADPYCMEEWPDETWQLMFFIYGFVAAYCAPLIVIIFCNCLVVRNMWKSSNLKENSEVSGRQRLWHQRRARTTRMICVVAILFGVSWLPTHILAILARIFPEHFDGNQVTYALQLSSNCLAYSNSCMNPFVYAFMGSNFRKCFKEVFSNVFHRHRYRGATLVLSECQDSGPNDETLPMTKVERQRRLVSMSKSRK